MLFGANKLRIKAVSGLAPDPQKSMAGVSFALNHTVPHIERVLGGEYSVYCSSNQVNLAFLDGFYDG